MKASLISTPPFLCLDSTARHIPIFYPVKIILCFIQKFIKYVAQKYIWLEGKLIIEVIKKTRAHIAVNGRLPQLQKFIG